MGGTRLRGEKNSYAKLPAGIQNRAVRRRNGTGACPGCEAVVGAHGAILTGLRKSASRDDNVLSANDCHRNPGQALLHISEINICYHGIEADSRARVRYSFSRLLQLSLNWISTRRPQGQRAFFCPDQLPYSQPFRQR